MIKNLDDLKNEINEFDTFKEFIKNNPFILSTGRLSEYYCHLLFGIRLSSKPNELYDGIDIEKKKVEIKQRMTNAKVPEGMKINLNIIDYVLYVFLNEKDLLPERIIKIDRLHIKNTTNGRVSFKHAFLAEEYETLFER